ncbi:olfactory receptor Olr1104 [Rattus norvegicus]|uniref:Olfactory receptor n=1 Tax=Rattus norvegicus TaxID=10116 RepID=D4AE45_RAT|nr:olfactory receptor Olr1104 [Rattus norvegicus]|eukprot:NP_001000906.1 olfactory receptor Olr1104 [Rattus norvegicus]
MGNVSAVSEFILLGLSADAQVQAVLFMVFLVIYVLTLTGNSMILLAISTDARLRSPMYFFLGHLSFLDLLYSSVSMPKMLENLVSERKTISVKGCLAQAFFVFAIGGTEALLLAVMAYDRYAAICHPLLYHQMMSNWFCQGLVWGSWSLAILNSLINTLLAVNLDFCHHGTVHNYNCELPSLFPLSCSDVSTNVTALLWTFLVHASGTFLLMVCSYGCVFSTILNMSSTRGRSKAFSTCSSHLTVVTLYFGSAFLRYVLPTSGSPVETFFSLQYSVITPLLNPFIYSLKNKEVKTAMRKLLGRCCQHFGYVGRRRRVKS